MINNFSSDLTIQPMYRDHLFIAIFGKDDERSKRWRLELYNALNDSNYSDPEALELNTLENVIFIKMHNDVSFLIDSQMTLYEHQSSPNPNMPLRGLLYFAQLYQKYISREKNTLISETLRKIPNPNYVVFYNGRAVRPEQYDLHLSDAFICEDKSGNFEWTAHVININENENISLQKKCKPLYDYISFVSRINHKKEEEGMSAETAVREAVDWAISQNLLEDYIKEQKEEIIGMLLEEYDEQACIRTWQEDGFIKGHKEGHKEGVQEKAVEDAKNLLKKNIPIETITECIGLPLEQVLELQKQIEVTC